MPTAAPIDDFRQAAKDKFAYISNHLSDFGGWKLGNSLDTMIDYLAHVDSSTAESFGNDAKTLCDNWIYPGNPTWTWFDDFGWFVISTDRASRQSFFSSDVQKAFGGFSKECWTRFSERAPYTWKRRASGSFSDYGPAVAGGCGIPTGSLNLDRLIRDATR
jgi:hypothetical protein